ncbi:transglutaminase family protein [Psychromarinibacter sp. C21-152]|uniref:Transglutaminase family protein n=1 Tax=Psychromarinibacter sediminicola TaxID=3033385 RepID=A0AAE3T7J9_9RHOB|nr:transglutaminase family protein [Psychromarinibacter sediminicola]MDF0600395.1 transglutaminase family protein [Psychromarinibacter sediminicola]
MRLSVSHRTTYRFAEPVRDLVQSQRLQPADCENQRVVDWSVRAEGGQIGAGFRDGAGDWVQTLSMRGWVSGLTVEVAGEVETADLNGVLRGHRETVRPPVYLRHSRATRPSTGLRRLAEAAVAGEETGLGRAHALARTVTETIVYSPGETDAATTAAEALEHGYGVCQDQTHVLIAAALTLGIPARYVAGYLFSEGGDAMAEASHAWAELFLEGLGWVGFDPANACCPDARYIRLGSGFDAVDAAPIRGVAQGVATEYLDVEVNVAQVQQQ